MPEAAKIKFMNAETAEKDRQQAGGELVARLPLPDATIATDLGSMLINEPQARQEVSPMSLLSR